MTTSALASRPTNATWINASIITGSAIFVFALTVSAIFLPQWRVLHSFQGLIYAAVVVLAWRRSAWGFGAGFFIAVFWNALSLFRSPEGTNLLHGRVDGVGGLIQLFALIGNFIIIVAGLVGFSRTPPGARRWVEFVGGGALAIGYLLAMVFLVGPPEGVEHIKQAFGF